MGSTEPGPNISYPKPAKRLASVVGNVWEWIFEISSQSPIQPIANLGHGMMCVECQLLFNLVLGSHSRTREFNPPAYLIYAHQKALLEVDCNQYGPSMGRARFKKALADFYSPVHGRTLNAEKEIAITTGATAGILATLMAFVEEGDEVIVIEPFFNLYEYLIKFVGGVIKSVALHPPLESGSKHGSADDWSLDMKELDGVITSRTKMLIINTPHNPLGKVFTTQELYEIGNLCANHNMIILSDEVYEHLCYTSSFPRLAALSPEIACRTISIGSVGKTFNATGWRVGFAIGDENLIEHVQWAHILLAYVTPGPAQEAAAVAYEQADQHGFWNDNKQLFKTKVDNLCRFLDELGLPYVAPSGAYFIFVNIEKLVLPKDYEFPSIVHGKGKDWKICWYSCQELGVATVPGSAFFTEGKSRLGQDYLRFIVCKTDEQLELAKSRLNGLRQLMPTGRDIVVSSI